MAEPVIGTDVVCMIKKNDQWLPYACAIDVQINFEMETKSVKTIGDGNWEKPRGQKKGYDIDLSGLIKFDDDTVPHAFDIYSYFDNMVSMEHRMIFTDSDGNVRGFEGLALPVNLSLGGGSEGFANGSAKLKGDGPPTFFDVISECNAEITGATQIVPSGLPALRIDSISGGPIYRFDWSEDDGARTTLFTDGTLPQTIFHGNAPGGVGTFHTLHVWPICDNGQDGEEFTIEFENLP